MSYENIFTDHCCQRRTLSLRWCPTGWFMTRDCTYTVRRNDGEETRMTNDGRRAPCLLSSYLCIDSTGRRAHVMWMNLRAVGAAGVPIFKIFCHCRQHNFHPFANTISPRLDGSLRGPKLRGRKRLLYQPHPYNVRGTSNTKNLEESAQGLLAPERLLHCSS